MLEIKNSLTLEVVFVLKELFSNTRIIITMQFQLSEFKTLDKPVFSQYYIAVKSKYRIDHFNYSKTGSELHLLHVTVEQNIMRTFRMRIVYAPLTYQHLHTDALEEI